MHKKYYELHKLGQEFLNGVFKAQCNGRFSDVTNLVLDCEIKEVTLKRDDLQIKLKRELSFEELEKFAEHYVEMLSFFYPFPRDLLRTGILKNRGCALVDFDGEVINCLRTKKDGSGQPLLVIEQMRKSIADSYYSLMESSMPDTVDV